MGAFDHLLQPQDPTKLGQTDLNFFDADTLQDDEGKLYRIQGYDAPEVEKFTSRGYQTGTAGGEQATKTISKLANDLGFTNMVKLGELDATETREMVDLQNDKGESFTSKLLQAGVFDTTGYSQREDQLTSALGEYARAQRKLQGVPTEDAWQDASQKIFAAAQKQGLDNRQIREKAFNEAQLATGIAPWRFDKESVQVRDYGRDLDNWSRNPFSDSIDIGLHSAAESLYGVLTMSGIEPLEDIGEAGKKRAQARMEAEPNLILSYDDVNGFWGKDGFAQFAINNIGVSLPYMAATVGSIAAQPLVAPFTAGTLATGAAIGTARSVGGLALTTGGTLAAGAATTGLAATTLSPIALYTGNVWNDMEGENKNRILAVGAGVTQSVLDRLGLKGIFKGLPGSAANPITNAKTRETIIKAYMKKYNVERGVAELGLLDASKKALAELSGDALNMAKQQLGARNFGRTLLTRAVQGGTIEGVTEGLQEAIAYTAAHNANDFSDWDANEFNNRVMNGIAAGTASGATIGVPVGGFDYLGWADVAFLKAPADSKTRNEQANNIDRDKRNHGKQINIQELNEEARKDMQEDVDGFDSIAAREKRNESVKENRTITETGMDLVKKIPGLFQRYANTIFDKDIQSTDVGRWLAETFGANNQRSTSGSTYENFKRHLVSAYKSMIPTAVDIMQAFGYEKPIGPDRKLFTDAFYETVDRALAKAEAEGREVNWDLDITEGPFAENIPMFKTLVKQLNELGDEMLADQRVFNTDIGYIPNYLLRYKSFNKLAIDKDRAGFERKLVETFGKSHGITPEIAKDITDQILNVDGMSDFEGVFSGHEAAGRPGTHKRREFGLADYPEFRDYMEQDIFNNISNAAKSAARYVAYEQFVGKDKQKLAYQLKQIETQLIGQGWSKEAAQKRVDRLAKDISDYLDVESGNYKRIENETLRAIQDNFLFFSAIISLPLSTVSNFVELPMQVRGLTAEQIAGPGNNSLKSIGENLGKSILFGMTTEGRRGGTAAAARKFGGYQLAQTVGFFETEVGAATTSGAIQMNTWQRNFLDQYFKANQLQGWTNAMRASRAGMAGDYINNHLAIIRDEAETGETRESYRSREALRNIGIDPDFMNAYLDKPTAELSNQYELMLVDGIFNFVNEAIALPQAANRPRIFQDPRFALFTQFQGFISTFTANHIPRMWDEYIKRGSPMMRFQAFSLIATMIMMGFASQALKDKLKYGTWTNPYLDDEVDYIRRGIASSGWLGTGERVLDFAFPIYENRYQNPVDWAIGTVTGESAAITKGTRIFSYGLREFDPDRPTGWDDWARVSPATQALWSYGTWITSPNPKTREVEEYVSP